MIFYLWEAGKAQGVAGEETEARERAEAAMLMNGARTAVVASAHFGKLSSLGECFLGWVGLRWTACRAGDKVLWSSRWVSAGSSQAAALEKAAS
jgi:hypothetical protein